MGPVKPNQGLPMPNVGFILVYVENVAASEAFYASILGRPASRILRRPSRCFPPRPASCSAYGAAMASRRRRLRPAAARLRFPSTARRKLTRLFADWRGRGVKIAQTPTKMDFGYTFLALDPDGQRLRVFAPSPP